ncbi:MAG TPA: DUF2235 domain-containing protein [Candidatus Dormibacteraeota bacterium]|nr:DUF2235 domain-containing protein [Candidatus Dormibacteraeota bacterium]
MVPDTSLETPTASQQSSSADLKRGIEPKNIVICCDGTGNEFGDHNSNVIKLYKTLVHSATQIAYYHPGVGTMGARNALSSIGKWWTKVIGLAFGYGISDNIADAYQFLMRTYRPGDVVFVFGFSRGAYTARALCGMLHIVGLLFEDNEALIPYAIRMIKGKHVDFGVAAAFKKTFSRECRPHFVGVWDTVSSLGWVYNAVRFPFTNATNNPDLSIVRHAISIDERRAFFRRNSFGPPNNSDQDVSEVWFAGVHSNVGGSYPESESQLSQIALRWMICEAGLAGLLIDSGRAAEVLGGVAPYVKPDPLTTNQHESLRGAWWIAEFWPKIIKKQKSDGTWHRSLRVNLGRRRWIPENSVFHESVRQRLAVAGLYSPTNLPKQRSFSTDSCTTGVSS